MATEKELKRELQCYSEATEKLLLNHKKKKKKTKKKKKKKKKKDWNLQGS